MGQTKKAFKGEPKEPVSRVGDEMGVLFMNRREAKRKAHPILGFPHFVCRTNSKEWATADGKAEPGGCLGCWKGPGV